MASFSNRYALAALFLFVFFCCSCSGDGVGRQQLMFDRPCNEVYVVGEGETLHTISDKCGDPFIVEQNPHIHDPDDVFPGLVIKITPFNFRNAFG